MRPRGPAGRRRAARPGQPEPLDPADRGRSAASRWCVTGSIDADRLVRAWISNLDARSRGRVLATVLAPGWPRDCEAIVAAILASTRQARA